MDDLLASLDGRTAIIIAAEKLFAEFGLHGPSLRLISETAKQRNASVIQYHFGTRDKLVEAVFAYRMQAIDPRRKIRLDALKEAGLTKNVRGLISVIVWPLAEEIRPRPEGNHYVQFLSRTGFEKQLVVELAPAHLMTAWYEAGEFLRDALSELPAEVSQTRLVAAGGQCVNCLANFEADGLGARPEFDLRVETLIDMIAAGLEAPMSAESEAALKRV